MSSVASCAMQNPPDASQLKLPSSSALYAVSHNPIICRRRYVHMTAATRSDLDLIRSEHPPRLDISLRFENLGTMSLFQLLQSMPRWQQVGGSAIAPWPASATTAWTGALTRIAGGTCVVLKVVAKGLTFPSPQVFGEQRWPPSTGIDYRR